MNPIQILWADDEIDLLKPHILFLQQKGYEVTTTNNGTDAIELVKNQHFDIVFLDENMPGISGLETLTAIKQSFPNLPIVMITKSEEEQIMESAIGNKINDYLIKPVNPNQILLSIKKNIDNKRIVSNTTASAYQQEFRNISMRLSDKLSFEEWCDIYKKITYWELELQRTNDSSLYDIINMQKTEANSLFARFIQQNYLKWLKAEGNDKPTLSHTLFKNKILPILKSAPEPLFLIIIDNLRYDQWKIIQPVLEEFFKIEQEDIFCSILPTATQYARNAMFAGLMPSEIERLYPKYWLNDNEEGQKNQYEEELLKEQLKRLRFEEKISYTKITNHTAGKKLFDSIPKLMENKLNVVVYNFVDMLSHARTEMEVIKELADNEAAYRSLTLSWFMHSPLLEALKLIARKKARVMITTDHGTVRTKTPCKIVGDKNTNNNLRYKQGKNLQYNEKEVFEIKNPSDAFLPKLNVSQAFIFAKGDSFFAYPINYHFYVNYYKNTFQHGGISLEEMLIPFVSLLPK